MKRVSIAALAGVVFIVCSAVALMWPDMSHAGTSELLWVHVPSGAFSPAGTDISGFDLRGVWGSGGDDVFVVGPADTMIRFDGAGWSVQTINTEGRALNAVYGTGANNVFALANTNRTIFYSSDGENWAKRSSDALNNALYSLWGLSPDNMIATGKVSVFSVLLTYYYAVMYVNINNSANIATATPAAMIHANLYGVWGSSSDNVYAVGELGCKRNELTIRTTDYTTVWHYNGNTGKDWTPVYVPATETLYAIWGSAADDIFAVGANGRILHFDGLAWSAQDSPTSQTLRAVWGAGYDDVYAVGDAGTVLHFDGDAWSIEDSVATTANLKSVWGSSASKIYIVGSNGTIIQGVMCVADSDCDDGLFCNGAERCADGECIAGSPPCSEGEYCDQISNVCVECLADTDCSAGYQCVEGTCEQIPDEPPAIGSGPHVADGTWPLLSSSQASPTYLRQNTRLLWTFSDDFASCTGACTHTAEYQAVGSSTWTALSVSSDAAQGYAWVDLPVTGLQNATTYAFRFSVTDCAAQTAQSQTYYFRTPVYDAPPEVTAGPFVAAGAWPALARSEQGAFVLSQGSNVLWTFSDDYASCSGPVTHRAWYRLVGEESWTPLAVGTDPEGTWYAYVTLPVLNAGTYQLLFDVRDCAGQYRTPGYYYFKVE